MKKTFLYIAALFLLSSCTKDFLDKKPDKSLLVPTDAADFQAILDNYNIMNVMPGLGTIASDHYYLPGNVVKSLLPVQQNSYLWKDDIFEGQTATDWNTPYKQVFYANVVLDGLAGKGSDGSNDNSINNLKGSALFYRSLAFYNLSQIFAAPYVETTAVNLPGIPIRLSSDVNVKVGRGTLKGTYQQIVGDLITAMDLLPTKAAFKNRPSKAACAALLARTYLCMGDYKDAGILAGKCLSITDELYNLSDLDPTADFPFPEPLPNDNKEVLFYQGFVSYSFFTRGRTLVDSTLYRSYTSTDLRKPMFFYEVGNTGVIYSGFTGIGIDEQYLIKAEVSVRSGDVVTGINTLNTLLQTRYEKGTYKAIVANERDAALKLILEERRKELVGRDLRWTDLRRLNNEEATATTLKRIVDGVTYVLPPNDKKYVFPIPPDEIQRSGIQQNPR
ncbi:RagB/SusD family nutrient uptake outer membrane protein [Mucilaginibacter rubeus]|uniref:RagB/SusD family nutrient uptake outer membrane protein n=1 Tax=Mucilaginibacter rubeus TaxID=2027860 RepID=UPI00166DAAF4|nr:RagB/SusD family nutrient uptake outer membrane protein [Mucilaginibacter rubeus]GGA95653.1 membrane protein [Mucilaginibacter rubeus]